MTDGIDTAVLLYISQVVDIAAIKSHIFSVVKNA